MKKVVILGAGGHGHVIADIIRAEGNQVVAFLDDNINQPDCLGPISDFSKFSNCEFVIGIGNNDVRKRLSLLNLKWHTAIHPSAIISPSALIGLGTVVMPNVVVNANSVVGNHCILNTCSVIEHNNIISDFVHMSVMSKTGGNVRIGEKSFIGIGSTIRNNITICDNTIVGAGSLVLKDIIDSGIYYGIPVTKQK